MERKHQRILTASKVFESMKSAFFMLDARVQFRNPVMFITYCGAIITTFYSIFEGLEGHWMPFHIQISLWLWFTVFFANFAEAFAESQGKFQVVSLRKNQMDTFAFRIKDGKEEKISALDLKKGDIVICREGAVIPADGEVIEGIATVDESAITGESAPVIRESGLDRSAVTAGTKVVSDKLKIKVTSEPGKNFLDQMVHMIEGTARRKTLNEISLNILLCGLAVVFFITIVSLKLFSEYTIALGMFSNSSILNAPVLIALWVCMIPTTISGLLGAVGIAGMDRLLCLNVIAKSGQSVEAAGDIDLLILDKTGTITIGNRMAAALLAAPGIVDKEFAEIAQLASLSDETPEGRSIVVLAKKLYGLRAESLKIANTKFVPFSAKTRMSGIDFFDTEGKVIRQIRKGAVDAILRHVSAKTQMSGIDFLDPDGKVVRQIRKGAVDAVLHHVEDLGGAGSPHAENLIQKIATTGGTPLLVSDDHKIVGVIDLRDVVKGGIRERFEAMRKMGIRTLMITGDNPLTAAAIAAEAGVDDFVAEAGPEIKLEIIKREQKKGSLVAMAGDGTNDAPALAQADVGVAMNTGTQASREAGNMVDLDSNPTKLLDIVEIGKQLLTTRGALTTFSIANDIAKYFAVMPAVFCTFYVEKAGMEGPLELLNVMMLHSPKSAILSAVIFNSLMIVGLIPLALRGVGCRAKSAHALLKRNILIYGLGGIVLPFIGIKLIDTFIAFLNWV